VIKPIERELSELKSQQSVDAARLKEIAARPQVAYMGVWKADAVYNEGALVTRGGSLWCATQQTDMQPGADPSWRLIVKSGQA
jgi:hypothetical protein